MADVFVQDGALEFTGGQDASKVPDQVPENGYYAGINVSTYNGIISPRPGWNKLDVAKPEGFLKLPTLQERTYADIFKSGKFQAAIPYNIGQESYLIIVISGIIYLINQRTLSSTVIEIEKGERINELKSRINWASAGKYIILFDYPAYPIIIEETTARRADPKKDEVPISVMGVYNQNRVFISNAGNDYTAGDPVGSTATPGAPITFREILTPGSPYFGQVFQLPTNFNNDPITAMGFLQTADTNTGIGSLLIANRRSIYTANTQNPRNSWESQQFTSMLTYDAGIVGARAMVNVNSDMFFLANDGQIRALSMSRDEQQRWSKVPISREVSNWIKYTDDNLKQFAVLGYFDNKIFVSVNPFRTKALTTQRFETIDYAHGGLVVLELDNISKLGNVGSPAWAGLWTGIRPMDIITVNNRCFVIAKDPGFENAIYELTPGIYHDQANGLKRKIKSHVYTREYSFQDPFQNKEVHSMELSLQNVHQQFDMQVKYKPSQGTKFALWRNFSHYAPTQTCKIPNSKQLKGLAPHSFRDIRLGSPEENPCEPISNIFYTWFRKLQLKFTFLGNYWELHEFKLKAVVKPQSETDIRCEPYPPVEVEEECDTDWSIGEYSLCQTNQTRS